MNLKMFKILLTVLLVAPFPSYGFWIDTNNKQAVPLRGATVFRFSQADLDNNAIDWEKVFTSGKFDSDPSASGAHDVEDPPISSNEDHENEVGPKTRGIRDIPNPKLIIPGELYMDMDSGAHGPKPKPDAIKEANSNNSHSQKEDANSTEKPEAEDDGVSSKVMIGIGIFIGFIALLLILFYVLPWKKNSSGSTPSGGAGGEDQPEGRLPPSRLPPATVSLIGSGYKPRAEREAERAAAAAEAARTGRAVPQEEGHFVPVWQPLPPGQGAPKHGKGLPPVHYKYKK